MASVIRRVVQMKWRRRLAAVTSMGHLCGCSLCVGKSCGVPPPVASAFVLVKSNGALVAV
eukprot:1323514-Amphidinium_carterae.1